MWLFAPQLHASYAHQWTNVWLLNFWCSHWTTVVFIELLRGYWTNEKLNCTCSPTLVLTKGTKAHQRNVSSARLIVYTAHFIRAGLDFQDRVPILSVLGLPLDMVRARVKFWSGTDGAKSFTRLNLSVPNQFFWYAYFFHPIRAKNFGRVNAWGFSPPPLKVNWCRRLLFFFWLRVHVISLNLIAFIISIETEDSLLTLAKLNLYINLYIIIIINLYLYTNSYHFRWSS